ncbi:hypothetical protein [Mycolicibacterium chlorophenolicum]|uniref:Uncharacterized protein n=1 Tax=Mycolicibacterium chlorophenolicum TaxID=37916 RepID=A0A0J6Y1K6_9MYCO|nr:hypothetical protein [Mycolicibacterium chlorophenolicum]KMO67111.1 hypothetical protein MCHLDSM_06360 [Mycolicibacterium chlorophenolicum]
MNAKDIARQRAVLGKRVKALKDLYASDDLSTEDYQREMVAVQERKRKLRALEKKLKDQETPNLPAVVEGKTDEGPRSSDPMVIGQPAKWSEEWWMKVSPQTQAKRCHAKNTKGQRCQRLAISGAKVCYTHGGAAPHVRAAALARLQNGSVDMADNLIRLAKHAGSEAVQLGATNSALDRAGVKTAAQVEVGPIKPHEQIFDDVLSGSYAESRRARGFEASESITEQRNS